MRKWFVFFLALTLSLAIILPFKAEQSLPALQGKYKNESGQYMDICIDNNIIYAAMDHSGVQKVEFKAEGKTKLLSSNDLSPSGMQTYAVLKDGDYLYAATRTSGGKLATTPIVYLNNDKGAADLSNGGDGWDSGQKTAGLTFSGQGEKSPLGSKYGVAISWNQGSGAEYANVSKVISGGSENYAMLWVRVDNPISEDNQTVSFSIFKQGSANKPYQIEFSHQAVTNTFNAKLLLLDSTLNPVEAGSAALEYDTWYLFKCCFKVDAAHGGGTLEYKTNIADDWTLMASKLDMDTKGLTPTSLCVGVTSIAPDWSAGAVHFDEVYFDTKDLDTLLFDEGKVDSIDVTDLSIIDSIYFEGKCCEMAKLGDWLLVTLQNRGMVILDVSDPANLRFLGHFSESGNSIKEMQGIAAYDNGVNKYAYMAYYFSGFTIIDITDPANITQLCSLDYTEDTHATTWRLFLDYPYVYGTKSVSDGSAAGTQDDHRGLVVYDVTDPLSPVKYEYELPPESKDVFTTGDGDARPADITKIGNHVYLANGTQGIAVYDVTDPKSAYHVADIAVEKNTSVWAIETDGSRIYVGAGRHKNGNKYLYVYSK